MLEGLQHHGFLFDQFTEGAFVHGGLVGTETVGMAGSAADGGLEDQLVPAGFGHHVREAARVAAFDIGSGHHIDAGTGQVAEVVLVEIPADQRGFVEKAGVAADLVKPR